ncbi:helix-turn-helix domain-containing protein [Acidovorax sp. PRC11]|uniref:helix-turn-helix domain-containing protein n=1 Tax=Acidovorax sp. PRC11 TaxID=2962592 RepID=UPI002881BCF9|nr:helix-turn-helix domain-containing protein [Acidovorax sp. PRC11]MDT0139096.1 helix-turn-helix domain-containing protein [Acidovorax sp. PRC11]
MRSHGNRPVALYAPLKNRLDLTRLAELDRQFCEFARLQGSAAPRCGWAKTIRLALGMSSQALASRLGMTAQGVRKLEQAEASGTISLNTLSRLARGLDCDVHYILVPRVSLIEQVLRRTHAITGIVEPETSKVAEIIKDPEALQSLSRLLSQVNKRGLW